MVNKSEIRKLHLELLNLLLEREGITYDEIIEKEKKQFIRSNADLLTEKERKYFKEKGVKYL
jgi:ribosomal protein L20